MLAKRPPAGLAELGGATLWINDWKQHIGASWVLAYDTDGRTGYGALVRLGGYVTAGVSTLRSRIAA